MCFIIDEYFSLFFEGEYFSLLLFCT